MSVKSRVMSVRFSKIAIASSASFLDGSEAGIFDDVDGMHSKQRVVLDNQNSIRRTNLGGHLGSFISKYSLSVIVGSIVSNVHKSPSAR
jgi:hypothetical protein